MKNKYFNFPLYLTFGALFALSGQGITTAQIIKSQEKHLPVETEFSMDSGKYGSEETFDVFSGSLTAEYELSPSWSFFLTVVPFLYQSETYTDVVLIKGKPIAHHDISGTHPHKPAAHSVPKQAGRDFDHHDTEVHHPAYRHDDGRHHIDHDTHDDGNHPRGTGESVIRKKEKYQQVSSSAQISPSPDADTPLIRREVRGKGSASGVGDTCIGATYRVMAESASMPEILLQAGVKIPTADAKKGLGTGEIDYQAGIGMSKEIGSWTVEGELSYILPGDPEEYNLAPYVSGSAGVATEVLPGLGTFARIYASQPAADESDSQLAVEIGLSYDFDQFGTVSAFFSKGLSDGSPDYGAGIAFSFLF